MSSLTGWSILSVLVWCLPLLAGAVLVWWARLGSPTACPPSCRRCGYNVSGRPADSTRCSECGADLGGPGAVVELRRTRSRLLMAFSWAMLFVSGIPLGVTSIQFSWSDWYFVAASNSLVAWHSEKGRGPFADRARDVWLRRFSADQLTAVEQSRLYDHLLTFQGDLTRPWRQDWEDTLHDALLKNKLATAQAQRYVRNTVSSISVRVRSRIRVGDPVPVEFRWAGRGGTNRSISRWRLFGSFREAPEFRAEPDVSVAALTDISPHVILLPAPLLGTDKLNPGWHRLHVLLVRDFTEERHAMPLTPTAELRETFDIEVVPAGSPAGEDILDQTMRQQVASAVLASAVEVGAYRLDTWPRRPCIVLELQLLPAPVDRAFEIYVERDGKRLFVGRQFAVAGQSSLGPGEFRVLIENNQSFPESLRVVLVGTSEALVGSVDQKRCWLGTMIYLDVPVRVFK